MGEYADYAVGECFDEQESAPIGNMEPPIRGPSNTPLLVWPNMAFLCHQDLRWLVENQAAIITARNARPMPKVRPVKAWPNGRVRIEFVGNWPTASAARAELELHLEPLLRKVPPPC